jgi:5-methylcytosine-specific restriction protein A
MPPRPPKPCRKPGCRNLATDAGGYCPEHKHLADEALALRRSAQDKVRGNAAKRGYGAHWQRVRHRKLRRDPLCAICARTADVVHHRDGNPRNNASGNLMSLCRECHERLHGRLRTPHSGPKPC